MTSKTVWLLITSVACILGCIASIRFYDSYLDGLSIVGSVASVVGLILAVYVTQTVRQIRDRYMRQVMLKECVQRLDAVSKILGTSFKGKNPAKTREYLSKAKGILKSESLARHFQKDWSSQLQTIDSAIKEDDRGLITASRQASSEISSILEELHLALIEEEWGDK